MEIENNCYPYSYILLRPDWHIARLGENFATISGSVTGDFLMAFTCLLIGQDNLLIQCGKFLLERNHQIKWVVSSVQSIQIWCNENNISYVNSLEELPETREASVDYLFSIVNGIILTKEDLKIPRYAAINYHDSLLPKYAGVNATTWSLLEGETNHGITWHIIDERIYMGGILYQNKFAMAEI